MFRFIKLFNEKKQFEKQHNLMRLINDAGALILQAEAGDYFGAIIQSMKMICACVKVENVHLWQNNRKEDSRLYYKQVCKRMREGLSDYTLLEFAYQDTLPTWETLLSQGKSINGPIDNFPEKERLHLAGLNMHSVLAVPIFLKNDFWGFVSFDNCNRRRVFSDAEENALRSWGLFAVGAVERGRITLDVQHTLTKLKAVISNYKGIIWSINNDRIITNFNGQYVKALGITAPFVEGEKLETTQKKHKFLDMIDSVEKTFREGPQDWISDIDGSVLHSYTSPIFDNEGHMLGIVGSTDDVTEMVKLQRELSTAVEAAKAASESKSRFLANMSHEMRTPLNAIIGFSEMELGAASLEGDSFVNIERIYSAGMTLLAIINDLLDISKIESGKFVLVDIEYDLPSMINDTINLNIVRLGSKPVQFRLHVDGGLPARLKGDELRVKQIFNNLLSNAFKYTDAGFVDWTISCVRKGDRVKLTSTISDTGKGIRPEDKDKIFKQDYFQTDLKANYYVEGTGLGLPITKNLIELMGGTASVESEYQKGTTFTIEIFQEAAGDEVIGNAIAENLSQFRYAIHRRTLNQKLMRSNMSYATVLVVDDVVINLDVARGMMKPYRLNVDCVTSGREAIQRVREGKIHYSAIFMDHMMPGMDGIEAVKHIREIDSEFAKTVPIIALTANALLGNDDLFLKNGFQAFLSKPIDILRMDQILQQWVRDKEKEMNLPAVTDEKTEAKEKNTGLIRKLKTLGINAVDALARFDNDEESYLRILRSFVTHAPANIETAKTSFQEQSPDQDLDAYRIAVHSIKGSSRGIGGEKIGALAEKLEHAAKEGNTVFIEINNGPFIETAEKFIASVSAFLQALPDEEDPSKPEKDAPDPKLLAVVKQAAENYDMAALQEAIKSLDAWRYRSHPDLVKSLKEKAGNSDFEAILNLVSA